MGIKLGDNINITAGLPNDCRYQNAAVGPYTDVTEANTIITSDIRYTGLTVNISGTEYWYKDGVTDPDLVEKTTGGGGGGSGLLNWTGSTSNAIGTYISVSGICAQPNLTFDGTTLSVSGTDVTVAMTDSASPNLTLGLTSEVGGEIIDYGVNFCQLAPVNSGYSGGFFRMDMRAAQTDEFFNIKATTGNTEETIFKVSREGNVCTDGCYFGDGSQLTGIVADNAACLGGQVAGSYLRSDVSDVKTAGNLTFCDNVCLGIGTNNDLYFLHNGSDSYISNCTGNLFLRVGQTQIALLAIPTSCTQLYHNGNAKLKTISTGVCVCGVADISTNLCLTGTGNPQIIFTGDDGRIKTNNTNRTLYIQNDITGGVSYTHFGVGATEHKVNIYGTVQVRDYVEVLDTGGAEGFKMQWNDTEKSIDFIIN